jgi:hypothetical protein
MEKVKVQNKRTWLQNFSGKYEPSLQVNQRRIFKIKKNQMEAL